MKRKSFMKYCCAVPIAGLIFTSCAHVREYQKSRINDSEMILANRKVEKNELNAQSYREVYLARMAARPAAAAVAIE